MWRKLTGPPNVVAWLSTMSIVDIELAVRNTATRARPIEIS
jgi:hypothetical protein